MKLYWMYTGKKKILPLSVGLALLGLIVYFLFPVKPDIPPEEAITTALENTQRAKSYEYSVRMSTVIDGQEQVNSMVLGQRENANRVHIKGEIYESEVDFYIFDSVTYTRDQVAGDWIKIIDQQLNQQDILYGELNPLANFSFKELRNAKFHGTEKINGRKLWFYSASPVINNPFMEMLWQDFKYEFWLEPHSLKVASARISAVSKSNQKNQLKLELEISNYNKNIRLKPPTDDKNLSGISKL